MAVDEEIGELRSFYPSNLRFEPPFESLKEPETEKLVEEKFVKYKQPTPKKYVDLTLENVLMKDIVIFKEDKNDRYPTEWMVNDIFRSSNQVGLIEQIDDLMWDDYTVQRKILVNIDELMKDESQEIPYEQFSHDSAPESPKYGPESPKYGPESPDTEFRALPPGIPSPVAVNSPSTSPSFSEWQKMQPEQSDFSKVDSMQSEEGYIVAKRDPPNISKDANEDNIDYERGEGPQIRTNLVRVYNKDGALTDSNGKKYDLKPKKDVGKGELEILGNIDDSDEEDNEDNDGNNNNSGVKKAVKILN
tara:strand:- start:123 stop:1034 length:912 start_codon:yes stop_codon:yes gene_type:complete